MSTFSAASGVSMNRASLPLADVKTDRTAHIDAPLLTALPCRTTSTLQQPPSSEAGRHDPLPDTTRPVLVSGGTGMASPSKPYLAGHAPTLPDTARKSESEDSGDADSDHEQTGQRGDTGQHGRPSAREEAGSDDSATCEEDSATDDEGDRDSAISEGDADSSADSVTPERDSDTEVSDGAAESDDPPGRVEASAVTGTGRPVAPASTAFSGASQIPANEIIVGAFLANGAFGKVYRGAWGDTDVALKKIDFEHASQRLDLSPEEISEALEWEVARLATTRHPNLVQFHGICHKEGAPYLVLEFCHQGSLQHALRKGARDGGPVPAARLWQWMLEISQALAYLHGQGMLHRDLKAENVLIDQYGRAKLADLGVAQVDALLAANEASAVGQGLQDMDFIAPENVGGDRNRHSSKASDIYALGLVLWQMVSGGKLPNSWQEVAEQDPGYAAIKAGQRMPIPDDCPPPFRRLIQACWRVRPAERATIADVLRELQEMAPQMHPEHGLIGLAMHLEHALHGRREEARHYVPSQVTLQPIEGSIEKYWKRHEKHAGKGDMHNAPQALQQVLDDFLAAPGGGALLLSGEGGLGKTLSTYMLADRIQQQWWRHFADPDTHPRPRTIPIFIRSHSASWTYADLKSACADILGRHGLQPGQATALVFVDGYDECRFDDAAPGNLAQHLGLPAGAKLIVTCRPGIVPDDQLQQRFTVEGKLQSCHYLSFHTNQLLAYLKQHLSWDEATYRSYRAKLHGSAEVRAVLRNPFVLYLLRQSWETVSKKPLEQLTRSDIYESFIEHIVTSRQGFLEDEVLKQLQAGHTTLAASFAAFAHEVALLASEDQKATLAATDGDKTGSAWGVLEERVRQQAQLRYEERQARVAQLSEAERKEQSRRMVLTEDDFVRLQQQKATQLVASLPLRPRAGTLEFIHKSVFEYCLAQRLMGLLNEDSERLTEQALEKMLDWAKTAAPETLMMLRAQIEAREAAPDTDARKASARHERIEAALFVAIAGVLEDRQLHAQALAYQRKALAIREKVFGAEHVRTAASHHNIGVLLKALDKYKQALKHHRNALAIREKLLGQGHADTAVSYYKIGGVLHGQDKHEPALEYYGKALAIQEVVCGVEHVSTADTYHAIGAVLDDQDKHAQALEYYGKALSIRVKVLGAEHFDTATSYNDIGVVLEMQDRNEEALEYYRKALFIKEKLFGADHTETAISYHNVASVLQGQDRHEEALEYYHKALAIEETVLGTEHSETAISYNAIAHVLVRQAKHEQALAYYHKALGILESVFGSEHTETAVSYGSIGMVLTAQGKHVEALAYLRKALAIREKVFGIEHTDTAKSYSRIGEALAAQGRHDEALRHFQQALEIRKKAYGDEQDMTAVSYDNIGAVLSAQNKHEQALAYCIKARDIRLKVLGAEHADTAKSYNNIGVILAAQDRQAEALEHHRQALAINEKVFGPDHINTAASYNNMGLALQAQGEQEQALAYYRRALAVWEKVLGAEHADTALAHYNIGAILATQGAHALALEHYRTALTAYEKVHGADHAETADAHDRVGEILQALGREDQALAHYRQALAIAVTNNDPLAETYRRRIESLSVSRSEGDKQVFS